MPVIDKVSLQGTVYDINDTGARTNKVDNSVIAPVESGSTASQAYSEGEYFIKGGAFCTAIDDISIGDTLTENTNYTAGQLIDSLGGDGTVILSATLTAGQTSVIINDARIHADSYIDVYTDTYGVAPTNVTNAEGTMTLTFESQSNNVNIRVKLS